MTLLQLGGYVGLLLWGTHMVGTGVELGFGGELRVWLGRTLSRPGGRARFYAFLAGLGVTAVLQSSTGAAEGRSTPPSTRRGVPRPPNLCTAEKVTPSGMRETMMGG